MNYLSFNSIINDIPWMHLHKMLQLTESEQWDKTKWQQAINSRKYLKKYLPPQFSDLVEDEKQQDNNEFDNSTF